ncbi:hypothetical protein WDU94_000623 [Cyamophila willieti]
MGKSKKKGGGIIVYVREEYSVEYLPYNFEEAENLILKIKNISTKQEMKILAIYRAPGNNENKFIDDLNWWLKMTTKKNESIIMLGDINICLIKKNNVCLSYSNTLYNNNLIPTINNIPTRERLQGGNVTSSCIDHINVKFDNYDLLTSAVIEEPIADHNMTGMSILMRTCLPPRSNNNIKTKLVNVIIEKRIKTEIMKIPWQDCNTINDPVQLYEDIQNKFEDLYAKSSVILQKTYKDQLCPWVDDEVRIQLEMKKKSYSHWKNNKSNQIRYEVYKQHRNNVTNLMKKKKRIYFYRLFKANQGNLEKVWRTIDFMLERRCREDNEERLKRNFCTNDNQELANNFNKNFVLQIQELKNSNEGPLMNLETIQYDKQCQFTSFYLKKCTDMDIERIITNLNNTGPGIDGIRPKEIKQYKYLFIPIIKKLINMIIETNVIPDKLKSSTITPIYKKKGKIDSLGSYRPVGSLPVIEKILEKYLHLKMTKYLDEHKIIPQFQHGFQKHKSTYTLLEEVTELINPALDNRMCAVIIALDLKSAFDTISHTGLIKKFKDIGIHNPLLSNYFLNRKQVTKVGNILSDEEVVHSGLVQGGICSPQWYNLYTHDIKYLDLKGEIKMFADDTALISIHKNLNIAIQNAQNDFIMVQKYFYNNSIFINDQKTETIIIGYIHNKLNTFEKITCHSRVCLENNTHGIQCSCPKLEYKSDIRYLGFCAIFSSSF